MSKKHNKKGRGAAKRRAELERNRKGRNRLLAISSIVIVVVAVSIILITTGNDKNKTEPNVASATTGQDASPAPAAASVSFNVKPSGPIKAKWIDPEVRNESVIIPVSAVNDNFNVHFGFETGEGKMNYMAYTLDNEIYVRANICPPCRSVGFSLSGDNLVCDRCATVFEAKTGNGVRGACVDYPKANVAFTIIDGNIVMNVSDLKTATQETIQPG